MKSVVSKGWALGLRMEGLRSEKKNRGKELEKRGRK